MAQLLTRLQRSLLDAPFEWEGEQVVLSFSAGIAGLEADDGGFDSLLGRADRAPYAAKQQGRQRVVVARPAGLQAAALAWDPA